MVTLRKNLSRPLSWNELDGNFEEINENYQNVEEYANIAQDAANRAEAVAASLNFLVVNVRDMGAVGDGVADDTAAITAAIAQALSGGVDGGGIFFPDGRYRVTDEINIFRTVASGKRLIIQGNSAHTSVIVADFYGADKAVFRGIDPAGIARCGQFEIHSLGFRCTSITGGANPRFIAVYGMGESRMSALRFAGNNNTVMSIAGAQNVRMDDIVSFYGGKHYLYKATDDVTFSASSGGTTVTASASIFSNDDIGKYFSINPVSAENRKKFQITTVASGTQATVNSTTLLSSNAVGYFEHARLSGDQGSSMVVANAACFVADDVGRTIYIQRGANSPSLGSRLFRAVIATYVSNTTVTLSENLPVDVIDAPFGTPTIEFYDGGAGENNDVKCNKLHMENFAGVGLVVQNAVFFHVPEFKIHGEHDVVDARGSTAHMWLDKVSGAWYGDLDGVAVNDAKVYVCANNDLLNFTHLGARRLREESVFRIDEFVAATGTVHVAAITTYSPQISPFDIVIDGNTVPRFFMGGVFTPVSNNQRARKYFGRNGYTYSDGSIFAPSMQLNINTAAQSAFTANNDSLSGPAILAGSAHVQTRFATTSVTPSVQIVGTNGPKAAALNSRFSEDGSGPVYYFLKSRNATPGQHSAVLANDTLGAISVAGSDGEKAVEGARIIVTAAANASANSMPSKLSFAVTAPGSPEPIERFSITHQNTYRATPRSTEPSAPTLGETYYDSAINSWRAWNGANWRDLDPSNIDAVSASLAANAATPALTVINTGGPAAVYGGVSSVQTRFATTSVTPSVQIVGTNGLTAAAVLARYSANALGATLYSLKSRSGAVNGLSLVQSGDTLGAWSFGGTDGEKAIESARIQARARPGETPAVGNVPGQLEFLVTANNAPEPFARMVLTADTLQCSVLRDYANDSAAASGGVPINGLYHDNGVVRIRLA